MKLTAIKQYFKKLFAFKFWALVLLIVTGLLAFFALALPLAIRPSLYSLSAGDVVQQDILAPRDNSYTSDILTNQAQTEAANKVSPVYLPVDPGIARRQLTELRNALRFISSVRADSYATPAQKLNDLSALPFLQEDADLANQMLSRSEPQWQIIQAEALSVLEQIMRDSIREDQVENAQQGIIALISYALPEDQATEVANIVTPFVVANSLYSEEKTILAQEQARAAVLPIKKSYVAGEIIVRRGQVITEITQEALQSYGFTQKGSTKFDIWAAGAITLIVFVLGFMFFRVRKPHILKNLSALLIISLLFLLFLYGAKLLIPDRVVVPYLFPLAAFGMTIASLFSLEISLILSVGLAILTAFGSGGGIELSIYYIITTMVGTLALGKGQRIAKFFSAAALISASGVAVLVAYRLPSSTLDTNGMITLGGAILLAGIASATLTLLLQSFAAQALGMTTALQLWEISRPDHPLLQFILRNAPGSYQHSLQVSNLAEQAAEAIGADALLTRVGAIYHDAGKGTNSAFFVENQATGEINTHDDLDPVTSAATIIRHVTDGIQLGRSYRLPRRIIDFMREHHGTLLTRYQYTRALQAAGGDESKVEVERFRYPGPRPQSRETALLMLADGCEARARASSPKNEDELRVLIRKTIQYLQNEGQLDDTNLTLKDLNLITESFVTTLRNTYHARIQYPEAPVNGTANPEDGKP
ncbi:MAG TPA: HDIG domain-containing protein [Anaerolineaceae bacterium]|nr:HDIG domain-containing protein [Anaerolineaceae bacterium]HQH85724.1 HDIG domain-containing protein [Anaerolineaceae bacterium]